MMQKKSIWTTAITTACLLQGLASSVLAVSFTIGTNVTGLQLSETSLLPGNNIYAPPDTMGAVGPNHFTEFINGGFAVYDKGNGALVQPIKSDVQFWADAGIISFNLSDPRILYDRLSERWFAVEINTNDLNDLYVAVSNNHDPTQGWQGLTVTAPAGNLFADFPTLGLNSEGLYVATNNFDFSGNFQDISIVSIPKADLLQATPTAANATIFQNIDPDIYGFTIQPVVDLMQSSSSENLLAVSNIFFNTLDQSNILNAAGPGAAILIAATDIDNVPYDSLPVLAEQPDGTKQIDAGDDRFSGNVYKVGNSLWATRIFQDDNTLRDAIVWYEIEATSNTLLQSGTIGDPDHDYYYPSINVNQYGYAVIGFTRSGLSEFASSYAVVGETVDNVTTFSGPQLLKAGTSIYRLFGGDGERWGDYSATTIDPNDPYSFWTIQEFAAGTDNWATQITQIRIIVPEPITTVPEASLNLSFLALTVFGLASRCKRLK